MTSHPPARPLLLLSVFGRPNAPGYPGEAELLVIYGIVVRAIEDLGWHITENDDDPFDAELELLRFDTAGLSGDWNLDAEVGERYVGTAFPPLIASEYRLAADALLLARAVGLRIGELLDLELDCVHEIGGHGAWLKVPLGKLDTERMVPLDDETVALVDRIITTRTAGRALPHPRTGRATQFLFTHHGRRLTQKAVRAELARSADTAGIGHVTPHQLRHIYATALVNAGVSLQALMALLGHVSAEMSLRYAHLFDATVRAEYERALDLAKTRIGAMPSRTTIPINNNCGTGCGHDNDWRDAPAIKSRLAGGHCLRAPAQGACPYANICEHCPSFRTDTASIAVLSAQRVDTEALAADAQRRGWTTKPTDTANSSPDSTPSSRRPPNDRQPHHRRIRLRGTRRHSHDHHVHRRRRTHRHQPHHPLPQPRATRRHRRTPPPQPQPPHHHRPHRRDQPPPRRPRSHRRPCPPTRRTTPSARTQTPPQSQRTPKINEILLHPGPRLAG
ncbi:MAG TPA: tyrosine-type recombinase/integrase [Acidimicrobiales bacterium]|nr:tyrosine-type recombinase/integrase [Acidimicrobiales bacterium]